MRGYIYIIGGKMASKKQQRWKLEMEMRRWILKGGKVKRCPTGVPADYHPYDTETGLRSYASVDNNYKIKGGL